MDIADFTAVGFVGLDVDTTVRIPEAYGTVLAAAEAIITVAVEPRRQYGPFVPFQYVNLLPRQIRHAHLPPPPPPPPTPSSSSPLSPPLTYITRVSLAAAALQLLLKWALSSDCKPVSLM